MIIQEIFPNDLEDLPVLFFTFLPTYLSYMRIKLFSYMVDGIVLQPSSVNLSVSTAFNKSEINKEILRLLKEQGLSSNVEKFNYVFKDNILFVEGIANEIPVSPSSSLIF